jgi:hypothetical protein
MKPVQARKSAHEVFLLKILTTSFLTDLLSVVNVQLVISYLVESLMHLTAPMFQCFSLVLLYTEN